MRKRSLLIGLIVVAGLTIIGVNLRLVTVVPADVATAADKWLDHNYSVEVMRGGDSLGGLGIRDVKHDVDQKLKLNDVELECAIYVYDGDKRGAIIYFADTSDAIAYRAYCRKHKTSTEIVKMDWDMRAVYCGDKDIYYSLLR